MSVLVTFSLLQAWRAWQIHTGYTPVLPPPRFMMRLHTSGEFRVWRDAPILDLMQGLHDAFYGDPED